MKLNYLFALLAAFLYVGCGSPAENKQNTNQTTNDAKKVEGYLYTTTNGKGENQIVQLARYADGTLGDEKVYGTQGNGGSDHEAPAHGDYDTQGSLQIIDDYIFTVNTGDNSVSIFNINRKTGDLTFNKKFESKGVRPVSIAFNKKQNSNGYWVVIANQWGTPTVLYGGKEKKRYPSEEFYNEDLTKEHATDKDRNIVLFEFDPANAEIKYTKVLANYVREWGGPVQVAFSPDGKKLGVTLWGIPHFLIPEPELKETKPSWFVVYDFENGNINNRRYFEESGVVGAVGFDWASDNETVYVSYFNLVPPKTDHGLVVLKDQNKQLVKISNHTTGVNNDVDEACWTVLSPNKDRLYVASFGTNVITPFAINNDFTIKETLPFEGVKDKKSRDDIKDMLITKDNKYLYCLGSFTTFSIKTYKITDQGLSFHKDYLLEETKAHTGHAGYYDLGGIVSIDVP